MQQGRQRSAGKNDCEQARMRVRPVREGAEQLNLFPDAMVRTRLASVVPGSGCDCSTPTCALLGRRRARAAAHERASGARRLRLCWHCWLALLLLLLIPRVTASRLSQLHSFIVPCARALLPLRCLCPSVYTTPAEKRKRKKKGKHILRPRGDPHCLLDAASFPASDRTRLRHRSKGKAEQAAAGQG